jgi:hypothetical protein
MPESVHNIQFGRDYLVIPNPGLETCPIVNTFGSSVVTSHDGNMQVSGVS